MTYEDMTNEQWERFSRGCGYLSCGYVPSGMRERHDALLKAWGDDPHALYRSRFDALMSVDVFHDYVMGA